MPGFCPVTVADDFRQALSKAREMQSAGRLAEAEHAYRRLAGRAELREEALKALVELYLQARRPADAINTLGALTELAPASLYYFSRLAGLLDGIGQTEAAIEQYRRLLGHQPELADAHFNLALLLKKEKRYADAIHEYEEAIRLGIDRIEQVYSNLGVLYADKRDSEHAAQMYGQALDVDPDYIPALFNRAGLYEEHGDKERATELFRRILAIDPRHPEALSRLIHMRRMAAEDEELLAEVRNAVGHAGSDPLAREILHFALGKGLDDQGRYDEAFAAYRIANETGSRRMHPYDRQGTEAAFGRLIEIFDADRVSSHAANSTAKPIFICGMFRSGSTLLEQILAAHPAVLAGGELDVLPWLVMRRLTPYPDRVKDRRGEEFRQIGDEYLAKLRELFPSAELVIDKRPDNFLHLGVIRLLFPHARVIYTKRNAKDNCLSIYFQQLGGNLNYATDLGNTAHYYRQHERLMAHWQSILGENMFAVDYDELVRSPEPVLRKLLGFLDLPWDEHCLSFRDTLSPAATASVWQVREALHSLSSGRWRNYESHIQELQGF